MIIKNKNYKVAMQNESMATFNFFFINPNFNIQENIRNFVK